MHRYLRSVPMILLVAALSRFGAEALANEPAPVRLTLERAAQLALENNEIYLSAQIATGRARAQKREAISEALPSLNLNTIYTRNWSLQEINFGGQSFKLGTDNVMNFSFNFTQPIYKGGKIGSALKIAKYFTEQSNANEEQTRQNVLLAVHQAYYGVLLTEAILRVNQASYDRAVAQLEQVNKFHGAGTVSSYDVLRAKVRVANAKPPVIQARNRIAVAQARLKNLIGLPQTTPLIITGDLAIGTTPSATLTEAIQTAATQRPDILSAQLQTSMTDKAISISRSESRPDISLSAGYQMQAQENDRRFRSLGWGDFSRSLNTQIIFRIPIFDGRQTAARVDQAEANYELALYSESRLKKQIEVDVAEAFLNVQEARERIAAEQEAVDLAERGLAIAQVQYENGMSTQLEVIDAQLVVTQAQTNHVTAQHDYAVAVVTLQSAQGVLKTPVP